MLLKLRHAAIQYRWRGLLSSSTSRQCARPHVVLGTQTKLDKIRCEELDHSQYSPDLAPSDFHVYPKLKDFLGGMHFENNYILKEIVTNWFLMVRWHSSLMMGSKS
uniref:Uncharacterized protein n=1 Tax=Homalodisca liturata TaxID=320908 RepID=A0A1B6J229_9HEMI